MSISTNFSTLLSPFDSSFDLNATLESNLTYDEILFRHCHAALMVDRAITPIWYIIGIIGNVVSTFVWLQPQMRKNSSSAIYLAALSVNDTLFLLLHPLQELQHAWSIPVVNYPIVCEAYAMLFIDTQYLAPVIVLCFSVDRFIAVCHPFKKTSFCTVHGAVKVLTVSVLGCLLLGSVQLYLWNFDGLQCSVREEALRNGQQSLWFVWSWISELVVFLLVPLFNLVFNVLVIREIRHISAFGLHPNKANVRHLANGVAATNAMLLVVSFYVIFTTLPATVVYSLQSAFPEGAVAIGGHVEIAADPVWDRHFKYVTVRKMVDEFCLSHYACNFFIFVLTGKKFRKLLLRTFLCRKNTRKTMNGNASKTFRRTTPVTSSSLKV